MYFGFEGGFLSRFLSWESRCLESDLGFFLLTVFKEQEEQKRFLVGFVDDLMGDFEIDHCDSWEI